MRVDLKRVVTPSALLLVSLLSTTASAQGLVAHHRVLDVQTSDGLSTGTIEVWVGNFTAAELANVDLRPAEGGLFAGDNGVLQLGAIPAGEARLASGFFMAASPDDAATLLSWRAEFDGPDGHAQVIVASSSLDLEDGR